MKNEFIGKAGEISSEALEELQRRNAARIELEVKAVKQLGEMIGYGNMITLATSLWRKKLIEGKLPPNGAFIGVLDDMIKPEYAEGVQSQVEGYDRLIEKYT